MFTAMNAPRWWEHWVCLMKLKVWRLSLACVGLLWWAVLVYELERALIAFGVMTRESCFCVYICLAGRSKEDVVGSAVCLAGSPTGVRVSSDQRYVKFMFAIVDKLRNATVYGLCSSSAGSTQLPTVAAIGSVVLPAVSFPFLIMSSHADSPASIRFSPNLHAFLSVPWCAFSFPCWVRWLQSACDMNPIAPTLISEWIQLERSSPKFAHGFGIARNDTYYRNQNVYGECLLTVITVMCHSRSLPHPFHMQSCANPRILLVNLGTECILAACQWTSLSCWWETCVDVMR